ncbi:hypothetical protein A2334_03400 [Candidatus Roizmanbacteria bacterium RIFOXYB2_FULL_38_10]|uniref:Uncharacterized protein n=1 Tax=Candidatus Roizmanbacteria bacterium RIFOXYD1_FULL_38_12 TaxID=1802093 RepID=A0A1F7L101_9BACT|nr:MAG: hypothetical protein A3K47_03445 [Candidatus Roizmanbacteria bacterium RIFOXYA2_FULL_38_14]OGK63817.1 MAG: hypothetical protein A3K27_03445 [Candidatus Roizmanbacteria bacterium RIFOXYA1_FULL_37_12]OGK65663.1 MAG: hypothetical protein A3K38_03445 [Candidatus Roizmanbacteria bacterium RIFOXYB1_FULL_40_23]OGK67449.1 MAG: hypothetical protein A2334_03400 [Candidatus Roizmanbacteria bacterium RIFOXYB2_FULL_38_10]OGK70068.1 MAG: hypothetical protein A3K21_03450 [Candidatus Roizmanbacteria ba
MEGHKDIEAYQALLEIDTKERSFASRQGYIKAYVLSILLPPIGLYYFIKYIFFGDGSKDDMKAGLMAFLLTICALGISIGISTILFKQMNTPLPASSTNILKEMITPANQDALKKLFQ